MAFLILHTHRHIGVFRTIFYYFHKKSLCFCFKYVDRIFCCIYVNNNKKKPINLHVNAYVHLFPYQQSKNIQRVC